MPATARPSLWNRLFKRAPTAQRTDEDDAADLGTAFGLDYVLDEVPAPMPWRVADDAPAAPPAA